MRTAQNAHLEVVQVIPGAASIVPDSLADVGGNGRGVQVQQYLHQRGTLRAAPESAQAIACSPKKLHEVQMKPSNSER